MKRKLITAIILTVFVFALAAPAAAYIEHEATYKLEGSITFSQQAGHFCNTGAEMQQRITGQGSMTKSKDVYMEEGILVVTDNNDWVTAPDAIRNLTVTTAIKLCAPAKHVYEYNGYAIPYNPDWLRGNYFDWAEFVAGALMGDPSNLSQTQVERAFGLPLDALGGVDPSDAISDQIWAVQVAADPGYSGQVDMAFEAAYSPNVLRVLDAWDPDPQGPNELISWRYKTAWFDNPYDDWPGKWVQDMGPWFIGNYFNIEQFSRTSSGTHRRHIDISSPWSHGYLNETMTVTGMSEVWEAFSMDNLDPGDEIGVLWWNLF